MHVPSTFIKLNLGLSSLTAKSLLAGQDVAAYQLAVQWVVGAWVVT
jgi:hypothetical protein